MIDQISKFTQSRIEAERLVSSVLLNDPMTIVEVSAILQEEHFSISLYRRIFCLVRDLHEEGSNPMNALSIRMAIVNSEILTSAKEFHAIVESAQSTAHAKYYALELRKAFALGQILDAAQKAQQDVLACDQDPDDVVNRFMSRTAGLSAGVESDVIHIGDVVASIHADATNPVSESTSSNVVPIPYPFLHSHLGGGVSAGSLWIHGGHSSKGKSASAAEIASHAAVHCKSVLVFSMEMTAKQYTQRILTSTDGVPMDCWKERLDQGITMLISEVIDEYKARPIRIIDKVRQTVKSIAASARLQKASKDGLDLVVIDNLALLEIPRGEEKHNAFKEVAKSLKILARDLDVVILLLAQLSVDTEETEKNEPRQTSWQYCRSIGDDADIATMIYPFGQTQKQLRGGQYLDVTPYRFRLTKNRDRGNVAVFECDWIGSFQRIESQLVTGQPVAF